MILVNIFFWSLAVAFMGAMTPGPLFTLTVAETAKRGFWASVLITIGHAVIELAVVLGLVLGLGDILKIHNVMWTVAVVGGLVLIWIGYQMTRDALRGRLDLAIDTTSENRREKPSTRLVGTGITVSAINPYWVIWWATVGLAGVTSSLSFMKSKFLSIGAFYTGHVIGDALWYLTLGAAIVTGRKLLSVKTYRALISICGLILIFLGGSFIYLAVTGGIFDINMTGDWLKK